MADLIHMGLLGAVVVAMGCAGCSGERPEFGTLRGASDAASDSHSDDSSTQDTSSDTHDPSDASRSLDSGAGTPVTNETPDEPLVGGNESDAGGKETTQPSGISSGVDDAGGSSAEEEDAGDGGSATNATTCTEATGACTGCDPCMEQDSSVGPYCGDGTVGDGEACDVNAPWCHECQVVPAIAAGSSHTCALLANGGVKCWGQGGSGQLGNADTSAQLAPVDVIGLSSAVAGIAAGGGHTCVLIANDGVKCWGEGGVGQLGNNDTSSQPMPVDVVELGSSVSAIAGGYSYTCAVLADGGVKCWGQGSSGQLGNNDINNQPTPVDVIGLSSGVSAIAAGAHHTCALLTSGGVKCWGDGANGELGNDDTSKQPTPVNVTNLGSKVSAIAAGSSHTCALLASGGVKCWGYGGSGRLGNNDTRSQSTPVNVTSLGSAVSGITAGRSHTCAVLANGGVKCWGDGGSGRLGNNDTTEQLAPVDVIGLSSRVSAIAAGDLHTCALLTNGSVKCWGNGGSGQLGNNDTSNQLTPVDVIGIP